MGESSNLERKSLLARFGVRECIVTKKIMKGILGILTASI